MAVLPSASLGCQRVQVLPRLAGALAIPGIYTSWAPSSAFHRVGALQSAPVSPGRTLVLPLNPRGAHTHMSFLVGVPMRPRPSWSPSPPPVMPPLRGSSRACYD